jgi:hypothetical protein
LTIQAVALRALFDTHFTQIDIDKPALSCVVAVGNKFYRAHARFVAYKTDTGSQQLVFSADLPLQFEQNEHRSICSHIFEPSPRAAPFSLKMFDERSELWLYLSPSRKVEIVTLAGRSIRIKRDFQRPRSQNAVWRYLA